MVKLTINAVLSSLILVGALGSGAAQAAADAARGKIVYLRCAACHNVKPGAANKVGPNLFGIVGRPAGGVAGFRYSAAMLKAKPVWNEATLDKWLAKPASVVPGTSMVFAGVPKAEDRQALIAYLKKPGT